MESLAERVYRESFEHPDHLCNGKCPHEGYMDARDSDCFYCSVMTLAESLAVHARFPATPEVLVPSDGFCRPFPIDARQG